MQPFPVLSSNQVAVLRAEIKTGHVVDDNLELVINDTQNAYTVFENMELAMNLINKEREGNPHIEYVIYKADKTRVVIS